MAPSTEREDRSPAKTATVFDKPNVGLYLQQQRSSAIHYKTLGYLDLISWTCTFRNLHQTKYWSIIVGAVFPSFVNSIKFFKYIDKRQNYVLLAFFSPHNNFFFSPTNTAVHSPDASPIGSFIDSLFLRSFSTAHTRICISLTSIPRTPVSVFFWIQTNSPLYLVIKNLKSTWIPLLINLQEISKTSFID